MEAATDDLATYAPRRFPPAEPLQGRSVTLEPADAARHADELFDAFSQPGGEALWTYLPNGPYPDRATYLRFAEDMFGRDDLRFMVLRPRASGRAEGVWALFRADLPNGVIELGHICLAPSLQKTSAVTEAYALTFAEVFDGLGYRRLEWKCNALNQPSRRAAERLGFTYEGLFRQHMIVKGANRDTAWFSMLDREWPLRRDSFAAWLDPANFDGEGRQRRSLEAIRSDRS